MLQQKFDFWNTLTKERLTHSSYGTQGVWAPAELVALRYYRLTEISLALEEGRAPGSPSIYSSELTGKPSPGTLNC